MTYEPETPDNVFSTAAAWLVEKTRAALRGLHGGAISNAIGAMVDEVGARADATAQLRMPLYCPVDALASNGEERNLERGLSEPDGAYRAWLLRAWEHWTAAGTAPSMANQVAHLLQIDPVKVSVTGIWPFQTGPGVTRVVTPPAGYSTTPQPGWELHDGDTAQWSRAWITVDSIPPWGFGERHWNDGGKWDGDMVWDSLATPDEVRQVTNVLNKWKPAHVTIASFRFMHAGAAAVIGAPGLTVGSPGLFVGSTSGASVTTAWTFST